MSAINLSDVVNYTAYTVSIHLPSGVHDIRPGARHLFPSYAPPARHPTVRIQTDDGEDVPVRLPRRDAVVRVASTAVTDVALSRPVRVEDLPPCIIVYHTVAAPLVGMWYTGIPLVADYTADGMVRTNNLTGIAGTKALVAHTQE